MSSPALVRCDAPGGHFRLIRLIGATRDLSARVRVLGEEPGTKLVGSWAPAAGLLFVLPKKNETAGIQVYINPYEPESLKVALRQPGFNGGTINFASAPANATLSITARLENGRLTTTADGIAQTAKVNDKVVTAAVLMCSSGSFEFMLDRGVQSDPTNEQQSYDPWGQDKK